MPKPISRDDSLRVSAELGVPDASTPDATGPYVPTPHASVVHPPVPAEAPLIPGYAITAFLAKGGMGRVWAGHDDHLEREVAIKTLLPGANAERFVTESKLTAQLTHPSIPPIYAMGTLHDGSPFLVMKLIRGHTLAKHLAECASLRDEQTRLLLIFEQIAQAVGFAHSRGIIHRDLKPLNIMVGEFGEVQVMDWGLAKSLMKASHAEVATGVNNAEANHTMAGTVIGTPSYMAPEQARGEAVDARADVFALGAILAAILTGRPAFVGASARATLEKAAKAELADVHAALRQSGADGSLVALVLACLAAKAADRPANGNVVAAQVSNYRQHVEAQWRRLETEQAEARVRATEQRKRRRALRWASNIVVCVLVCGITGTAIGLVKARTAAERERLMKQVAEQNGQRARQTATEARLALETVLTDSTNAGLQSQTALTEEQRQMYRGLLPAYRKFAEAQVDDRDSQGQIAAAALRLGIMLHRLGQRAESVEALHTARQHYQQLLADHADDVESRRGLIRCNLHLYAAIPNLLEPRPTDEAYLAEAQPLAEGLVAQTATDDDRCLLASILRLRGQYRWHTQKNEQCLASFEAARAAISAATSWAAHLERTKIESDIGLTYRNLARGEESTAAYRRAVAQFEKLCADPGVHYTAIVMYQRTVLNLVAQLDEKKSSDAAEIARLMTAIIRAAEANAAKYPSAPAVQHVLGSCYYRLALLSRTTPARTTYSADAFSRAAGPLLRATLMDPTNVGYRFYYVAAKLDEATFFMSASKTTEAGQALVEAQHHLAIILKGDPKHPGFAAAQSKLERLRRQWATQPTVPPKA